MRLIPLAALLCALVSAPARASGGPVAVDVELMLAVDVSRSMDDDEQRLQRQGYVEALRSPQFHEVLKSGAHGAVALAYMEWAGSEHQTLVLPFTLIDGAQAALDFATRLAAAPIGRESRTSISRAIIEAAESFPGNGFHGARRVIDVSGDGPNNAGPLVVAARDAALAKGFVINGLPIMLKRPTTSRWGEIDQLDVYYEDCVIGGPGAFSIPIRDGADFATATRRKLLMEISAPRDDARGIIPASAEAPRIDCRIGEAMWRRMWDN
jgi:hypothetical protein